MIPMSVSDLLDCESLLLYSPVYSVLEVTEEVVEPFSQSFSPLRLPGRLGDRKPSAESGLQETNKGIDKCENSKMIVRWPLFKWLVSYSSALLPWLSVPTEIRGLYPNTAPFDNRDRFAIAHHYLTTAKCCKPASMVGKAVRKMWLCVYCTRFYYSFLVVLLSSDSLADSN